jgi:hypothetical protein
MNVVVDYLQTDKTSGALNYRRKFPQGLVKFIPGDSPTGKGRVEFKLSLRARDINAPEAMERYRAAQQKFEAIVTNAEREKDLVLISAES